MQYNKSCAMCGKLFYAGGDYVYRLKHFSWDSAKRKSRYDCMDYFCSWTCYRKAQKEKENKKDVKAFN